MILVNLLTLACGFMSREQMFTLGAMLEPSTLHIGRGEGGGGGGVYRPSSSP